MVIIGGNRTEFKSWVKLLASHLALMTLGKARICLPLSDSRVDWFPLQICSRIFQSWSSTSPIHQNLSATFVTLVERISNFFFAYAQTPCLPPLNYFPKYYSTAELKLFFFFLTRVESPCGTEVNILDWIL